MSGAIQHKGHKTNPLTKSAPVPRPACARCDDRAVNRPSKLCPKPEEPVGSPIARHRFFTTWKAAHVTAHFSRYTDRTVLVQRITAKKFTNKPNYQRRSGRSAARSRALPPAPITAGTGRPRFVARENIAHKNSQTNPIPQKPHGRRRAGDRRGMSECPPVLHTISVARECAREGAQLSMLLKNRGNRGGRLR